MHISLKSCFIVLLAAIIPTGLCLKCFQCNSAEEPACADVVANDTSSPFLKKCTGLYDEKTPFCRKIVTKVLEGDYNRVVRSCGWILDEKDERKDVCRKRDSDFVLKKNCACFSEMCNRGANNYVPFFIVPVALTITLIQNVNIR